MEITLEDYAASLEGRFKPGTIVRYTSYVRRYLEWLGDGEPNVDSATRFLNRIAARRAKGTVGSARAAISHYLRLLDPQHDSEELPPLPVDVALKEEEIKTLLGAWKKHAPDLARLVQAVTGSGGKVFLRRTRKDVSLTASVRVPLAPELGEELMQLKLI